MLNPSTADAEKDDPTIRRCKNFSWRVGCNLLTVVNLYALRSPSPKALVASEDPEGHDNEVHVARACAEAHVLIAAWGASLPPIQSRSMRYVFSHDPKCLGMTKAGHPRHPLYVRSDEPLVACKELSHA